MAELIWAPAALKDIDNIASYIGKDSINAAKEQVNRFFQRTEILVDYPLIGNIVHELNDEKYRQLLCGRYRIIYRADNEENIFILSVYHQSRLLENNKSLKKIMKSKKK
jgi:toxin ParE1/3/4